MKPLPPLKPLTIPTPPAPLDPKIDAVRVGDAVRVDMWGELQVGGRAVVFLTRAEARAVATQLGRLAARDE